MRIQVEKKAGNMWVANASIEIKAWDACNQEGLGTTVITNDEPGVNPNQQVAIETAIKSVINDKFEKVMFNFYKYITGWLKNGVTYQVYFHKILQYVEYNALMENLKSDSDFGKEMKMITESDFMKLECNYFSKPNEFLTKLMKNITAIKSLEKYKLEPKIIFGRQIHLIPSSILEEKTNFFKNINKY